MNNQTLAAASAKGYLYFLIQFSIISPFCSAFALLKFLYMYLWFSIIPGCDSYISTNFHRAHGHRAASFAASHVWRRVQRTHNLDPHAARRD
jgi:hypothetical protein